MQASSGIVLRADAVLPLSAVHNLKLVQGTELDQPALGALQARLSTHSDAEQVVLAHAHVNFDALHSEQTYQVVCSPCLCPDAALCSNRICDGACQCHLLALKAIPASAALTCQPQLRACSLWKA